MRTGKGDIRGQRQRYYQRQKAAGKLRYYTDPSYRARTQAASRRRYAKVREQMLLEYGQKCACCGEQNRAFLTMDHGGTDKGKLFVFGTTKKGKPRVLPVRGTAEYFRLMKLGWPKDLGIRVLCMNCNFAERGGRTCPHRLA